MEKSHLVSVYLVIHILQGKIYIGKTVKCPWRKRWIEHKSAAKKGIQTYLYKALRFYGPEAFDIVKIDEAETNEEACELEKHYIKVFESSTPEKGYNLTIGGEGVSANEATRRKISETHKRLGTKPPGNKGVKFSPERCFQMSEARKGIPAWNKGTKLSPTHILHLKTALRPKVNRRDTRSDVSTDEMVRLYEDGKGLNCREIGLRLGISKATVARRLKKAGIVLRPVGFQKGSAAHRGAGQRGAI